MKSDARQERKAESRRRILHRTARRLRREGISGTSVERLMKDAGLTVGGFYAHFRSKDELVLEALRLAFREGSERLRRLPTAERVRSFVRYYLSPEHRDAPEEGCPVIATAFEAGRLGADFRKRFATELEGALAQRLEDFGLPATAENTSTVTTQLCTLVGAQLLARATRGTPLSEKVLAAAMADFEKRGLP